VRNLSVAAIIGAACGAVVSPQINEVVNAANRLLSGGVDFETPF
jgi:large-conductance mechanosensitive channel